ncbi:MAG: 2-acyl-glycerophospho-ethanolamine acyltransferase [Bacteroidetes bacterium ADurb.Bin397]|jgi:putative hemolysin|nr:MAG: 2-acyl-glycerophospho-ethanolamine acyltransferase [Bacteroidetes bacterium ADurb.Bin397]
MQSAENKKFIDIDAIFKAKNPGLYRILPRFIFSYLKRVAHQDDINDFIRRHGHRQEFDFVDAIVDEFGAHIEVAGTENIPKTGGCIFAANHPLGGLDAMALVQIVGRTRKDIRFIVNDILLQLKNLKGIFIGVNKHGKNTPDIYANLDDLYASGSGVLIFPAGLVSRKRNGKIRDLEWRKSFITKARKNELDVIPVFIKGKNSEFFYNLARFRERIGIKANIEMLYLADEMYRQKNQTITVIFGKPIPHQMFDKSRTDQEWAQLVKEHVYCIAEEGHQRTMKIS